MEKENSITSSDQSTQISKSGQPTIASLIKQIKKLKVEKLPSLQDYLTGAAADYFDDIKVALSIINSYKTGERSYQDAGAADDCLQLAAIHSSISEMVGYVQGIAAHSESARRVVKSEYYMAIKEERDHMAQLGQNIKLTEAEIDHAARTLASDVYNEARDFETVSRMLTAAWYSIGDFVRVLNSACNRAHKEHNL